MHYTLNKCTFRFMHTISLLHRAAPILVSVLVSGQYHHFQVVLELVKDAIQVPSIDSAVNIW